MSGSEKTPGFFQRVFGLGGGEAPKEEPPAQKPAKKEPPQSKPARTEPPERQSPPKKAQGRNAGSTQTEGAASRGFRRRRVQASAAPDAEPQGSECDEKPKASAADKPKPALGWLARLGQGLARSSTALSRQSHLGAEPAEARRGDARRARGGADQGRSRRRHGVAHPRGLAATRHDRGISPDGGARGAGRRDRQGARARGQAL